MVSKRKGYERGAWYEIRTVKDVIISKEKRGADATFERNLLKAWSKYPGYEGAKKALQECTTAVSSGVQHKKSGGRKDKKV